MAIEPILAIAAAGVSAVALLVSVWGVLVSGAAARSAQDAAASARRSADSDERLAAIEAARWTTELRHDLSVTIREGGSAVALLVVNKGQYTYDSIVLKTAPPWHLKIDHLDRRPFLLGSGRYSDTIELGTMTPGAFLGIEINPDECPSVQWIQVAGVITVGDGIRHRVETTHVQHIPPRANESQASN